MKKILLTSILLGTMVLGSIGVSASTSEGNNKWQYNKDLKGYTYQLNNIQAHDGIAQINNDLYYFDSLGVMVSNNWISYGNYKMYAEDNGQIVTGWKMIEGKWYYFSNGGIMLTGEINLNGKIYNLASDGHLL